MKLKEQQWLEQRVRAWAEQGLIQPGQAKKIIAHERKERGKGGMQFATLLAALGALCVVLGVVLVVAVNWESIPRGVKLAGFLLGLGSLGFLTLQRCESKGPGLVAASIAWLLLPLAGIGLWGQVYQLSGDTLKPFLVWLALGVPLVLALRHPALVAVYALGIVGTLFAGHWTGPNLLWLGPYHKLSAAGWALCAGLWAAAFTMTRLWTGSMVRAWLDMAFIAWFFYLSLSLGSMAGPTFALTLATANTLVWALAKARASGPVKESADRTGLIATSLALYVASFYWHNRDPGVLDLESSGLVFTASILILSSGLLLFRRVQDPDRAEDWVFDLLVFSPLAPALLACMGAWETAGIVANVLTLVWGLFLGWLGVRNGLAGLVNLGVLVCGALLLTRFFDLFKSMLASGLGFIVAGLVVLAAARGFNQGRQRLLAMAKGGKA